MKNRLLIFADHFLPGFRAGGPVLSLSLLYGHLRENFDPVIATRNRDFGQDTPYGDVAWDRLTRHGDYTVCYFSRVGWSRIRALVREVRPGTIYLNSFFSAFTRHVLVMRRLGLLGCPVVLAPRGELSAGALSVKAPKKRAYLALFRALGLGRGVVFHATDAGEARDIRALFRAEARILPNFSRAVSEGEHALPPKQAGRLKLLYLSRITEKKNLLEAIGVLLQGNFREEIDFHVVGPVEDPAYWEKCLRAGARLPPNVRMHYAGAVDSKDVLRAMSGHHALLLPTRNENFGHVIVEAMKLGLVPVISDRTPWRGLKAAGAGWDLPLDDRDGFALAVRELAAMDQAAYDGRSAAAREYIARSAAAGETGNREGYRALFSGSREARPEETATLGMLK